MNLLRDQRRQWCEHWQGADHQSDPWEFDAAFPPVELDDPWEPEYLREVPKTFKKHTCTPDGAHPRHFGMLCDSALRALALVFWLVDLAGGFPEVVAGVTVGLFAKPTAGFRPIGFFRALYRLWSKGHRPKLLQRDADQV